MRGEAADIQPVIGNESDLDELARILIANGKFDQLILYPTFIHVSHKRFGWNRKQVLQKNAECRMRKCEAFDVVNSECRIRNAEFEI